MGRRREFKQCPKCGFGNPVGRTKCEECFNDFLTLLWHEDCLLCELAWPRAHDIVPIDRAGRTEAEGDKFHMPIDPRDVPYSEWRAAMHPVPAIVVQINEELKRAFEQAGGLGDVG